MHIFCTFFFARCKKFKSGFRSAKTKRSRTCEKNIKRTILLRFSCIVHNAENKFRTNRGTSQNNLKMLYYSSIWRRRQFNLYKYVFVKLYTFVTARGAAFLQMQQRSAKQLTFIPCIHLNNSLQLSTILLEMYRIVHNRQVFERERFMKSKILSLSLRLSEK